MTNLAAHGTQLRRSGQVLPGQPTVMFVIFESNSFHRVLSVYLSPHQIGNCLQSAGRPGFSASESSTRSPCYWKLLGDCPMSSRASRRDAYRSA